MGITRVFFAFLRAFFSRHAALAAENLALRQQLAVLQRSVKRPRLRLRDRLFWVCLSKVWTVNQVGQLSVNECVGAIRSPLPHEPNKRLNCAPWGDYVIAERHKSRDVKEDEC